MDQPRLFDHGDDWKRKRFGRRDVYGQLYEAGCVSDSGRIMDRHRMEGLLICEAAAIRGTRRVDYPELCGNVGRCDGSNRNAALHLVL